MAAQFDRKIVVEQGVGGREPSKMGKARELEVAVLGNDEPEASVVGEIVPGKEFYDYEAKYLERRLAGRLFREADEEQTKQVREMALAAFRPVTAPAWRAWTS